MKNNMEQNSVLKNEKVASRIIEGQAFIVTPLNSTLHLLNETGTRIWELIEEKKNIETIIEYVCANYDIDRTAVEKDVGKFIEILGKKGIIKIVSGVKCKV